MFCPNCNSPLVPGGQKCGNCGAEFGEASAWTPTPTQLGKVRKFRKPAPPPSPPPPPRVPSAAEKTVKGIGCAFLVVGLGLALLQAVGLLLVVVAGSWAK